MIEWERIDRKGGREDANRSHSHAEWLLFASSHCEMVMLSSKSNLPGRSGQRCTQGYWLKCYLCICLCTRDINSHLPGRCILWKVAAGTVRPT